MTEGKVADIKAARKLQFPPGAMPVFDRGYCDYDWSAHLSVSGIHFVTRLMDNASWVKLEDRPAAADSNVRADEVVVFAQHATSNNHLDAVSLAAVYRQRWPIELQFKALKQNLKIKTFGGTSANALKIQTWTARIAWLLVRYLQLRSRLQWHRSRFVALLRHQLFVYRDLWRFLDNPFEGPPPVRKDYIAPQPGLFSWNQTGPPETSSTSPNGQPQIQNAAINTASPLVSIQPHPLSS
ncbi:MAG: transposase [Acidobacteriota bacterium]